MDFGAYLAAISRHKTAMAVGILLTFLLLVVTCFKLPSFELKLLPTFETTSRLLVTQPGAPEFRAGLVEPGARLNRFGDPISRFSDPSRYEYLADVYAQLALSDVIRTPVLGKKGYQLGSLLFLDGGKTVGKYFASVLSDQSGNGTLPIIQVTSQATSEREANLIAERVTETIRSYVARQQAAAGITGDQRVLLEVVQAPNVAKRVKGRPVILPLAVLLLGGILTIGLVFFMENLERAPRPQSSLSVALQPVPDEPRTEAPESPPREGVTPGTPPERLRDPHSPQPLHGAAASPGNRSRPRSGSSRAPSRWEPVPQAHEHDAVSPSEAPVSRGTASRVEQH